MVTLKNKNHHDNDRIRSTRIWRSNPRSTTLAIAAVKANGANKANRAGKNYYSNSLSSLSSRTRNSLFNSYVVILILGCVVFMDSVSLADGLRCYVCGGSTGRECEEIVARRWSPYVRPRPVLTSDGKRQWEECTDLINNKGCIKQVVNGVVLLRACWMQGSEKCMEDGDATVCTCNADLCNSARPAHGLSRPLAGLGLGGLGHGPAFLAIMLTILHVILTAAATPTHAAWARSL